MPLPYPIAASQTDAKSPVDDNLMDSIRLDLDYLNSLFSTGSAIFTWNINGPLRRAKAFKKAIDTVACFGEFQPAFIRTVLKKSGISGSLSFDIRKHTTPKTPIIQISHQYEGATTGIANVNPSLATQSVARATTQVSTQSISFAKTTLNIQSIINVGTNRWRYNLNTAPDADWLAAIDAAGKVRISGCDNAANDGDFAIAEVNHSGYPSIVIVNASGVAQSGSNGTAQLLLFSYNLANPASDQFAAGESAVFASHTNAANDGTLEIYATNQGGNNIWLFNDAGVDQAGIAGNINTLRWKFALLSAPSATDFIVGEKAKMAGHSSGGNDGNLVITGLNVDATNNITVYNESGVVQGGTGGTINTNRWTYSLPSDPSANITAGDYVQLESHTNANNNDTLVVKEVNRASANNVVVYNESGVTQVGSTGYVRTLRKLVKFESDQSAVYTTDSYIEMANCEDSLYNYTEGKSPFRVLQVNRGGGSNYNVVIECDAPSQASPAGYVQVEMKSIFTTVPEIEIDVTSEEPNQFIVSTSTDLVDANIDAATALGLYLLEIPGGDPRDLTVTLH